MFERFTDRARRVLVLAIEEAERDGSDVGSGHLLIGLIQENEGVAAVVLRGLGVTLDALGGALSPRSAWAGKRSGTGSPPLTSRAKHTLDLALREALQLGHNYIGTEHLLLGIAREGESEAAQALVAMGVPLTRVRQAVMEALKGYGPPQAETPPQEPEPDVSVTLTIGAASFRALERLARSRLRTPEAQIEWLVYRALGHGQRDD